MKLKVVTRNKAQDPGVLETPYFSTRVQHAREDSP